MATVVVICPAYGLLPAVLRTNGRREEWAAVSLLQYVQDCVDGEMLVPRWRAWANGDRVMSTGTMKELVQGRRHSGSHAGMENRTA